MVSCLLVAMLSGLSADLVSGEGELLPEGVAQMIEALEGVHPITAKDVFIDLGCGTGKVLIQVALMTEAARCCGVELDRKRVKQAQRNVDAVSQWGASAGGDDAVEAALQSCKAQDRLRVVQGDLSEGELWRGGTVVYAASLLFSEAEMLKMAERLAAGDSEACILVTSQELPRKCHKSWPGVFQRHSQLRLACSWNRQATFHMYTIWH